MDDVKTVYARRRKAQIIGFAVCLVGVLSGAATQNSQYQVVMFSVCFVVVALGVGISVLASRCPVCNKPANYVIMRMEGHDRCGRCWQRKLKMEAQPAH